MTYPCLFPLVHRCVADLQERMKSGRDTARSLAAIENLLSWKDLNPRIGASYDLFGNGKTAVKTSLSRYVASQTVGFASQFNPLGGTVTGAGFNGAGSDTRIWTDPNGDGIPQLGELGPTPDELVLLAGFHDPRRRGVRLRLQAAALRP